MKNDRSEDKTATAYDAQVLVVDDDEMGREAIERALRLSPSFKDSRVEACTSVRDAIKKLIQGMTPDLILCEMTQLGEDGLETGLDLYEWVEEHRQELLKTLGFVSCRPGINSRMIAFMSEMRKDRRLIPKPFTPEEIALLADRICGKKKLSKRS
jgi:CheY-like chemotaxis protein